MRSLFKRYRESINPPYNGKDYLTFFATLFILVSIPIVVLLFQHRTNIFSHAATIPFSYASVDTMKESMDTVNNQLTTTQIANDVHLAATLHTTHITVNTYWDYPTYMQEWINAIRAAGKHVWFRIHPNAWEGNNGVPASMTPSQYLNAESTFILAHPTFFQAGDILDMNPEPENSRYWVNTYGSNWSWQNAPNAATDAYNQFVLGVTTTANNTLAQVGITGVNTNVRSMNEWFYEHPTALYNTTVNQLGVMVVDSYPDQNTTDPTTAASFWLSVLSTMENTHPGVPIIIGEIGYSNAINVDDTTQEQVVKAELNAIQPLTYMQGLNYWVGAGTSTSGGYTHIFSGSTGNWYLRPAAIDLSNYFTLKLSGVPSSTPPYFPTGTPTQGVNPPPTSTPTSTPLPTIPPTPTLATTDTIPPIVMITNPLANSIVKRASTVTITINASDDVAVTQLQISVNGSVLCIENNSPYGCAWTVPGKPNASYILSATAFDAAGNTATSTLHVSTTH